MTTQPTLARRTVYLLATLVLVEIVASTLLGLGIATLLAIGGSVPLNELPFALAAVPIGLNMKVLALSAFEYGASPVMIATAVAYLVAIVALWGIARRLGVEDASDVDERLSHVRKRVTK